MKKLVLFPLLLGALCVGCGDGSSSSGGGSGLKGTISIDGSSTVAPIMEAVAEEFGNANSGVKATVATSGTGGGFKKFVNGEIDIANASRPIEEDEIAGLKEKGSAFIELPIAFDGLSIVVNPGNTWADDLTVEELKRIWEPNSKIDNWSQVRAGFPDQKLTLYGAGTDSGTFEYFTEAIVGKKKASRTDYNPSEDDNQLVQGVAGDKGALGYFGYAYYEQNKDKLKLVKVGGVAPSPETILAGTYQPLSRPLLIYINAKAADRPEVQALVKFLLNEGRELISQTGYVPLSDEAYQMVAERFEAKKAGSAFQGAEMGLKPEDILKRESGG